MMIWSICIKLQEHNIAKMSWCCQVQQSNFIDFVLGEISFVYLSFFFFLEMCGGLIDTLTAYELPDNE
jgi:hypothetical protein